MERLLVISLRTLARLLPPARQEWTEAVQAEAEQVPAGRLRLHWLAGGLWLVAKEASVGRKTVELCAVCCSLPCPYGSL